MLDNILGLVALFRNDAAAARKALDDAIAADPTNAVPFLNAAFTDMQFNEYQKAADRMAALIRLAPPAEQGVARHRLHDLGRPGWDCMTSRGPTGCSIWRSRPTRIAPPPAAYGREAKRLEGDQAGGRPAASEGAESAATFENYSEVASLYFHLSWRDNEPVIRSEFSNPDVVKFH